MKFMVSWRVHEDKRHETLKAFSEMTAKDDKADLGKLRLIGRWHDVTSFTGIAIVEAASAEDLGAWILNWNSVLDCEVTPVLDDAETRALGRKKSAG